MTIVRLAEECSAAIAAAEQAVAEGALLDLSGLETEIARLCAAAEQLPPGERAAANIALRALNQGLDRLAGTLRQQRDRTATVVEREARVRAGQAYSKPAGAAQHGTE